MTVDLIERYKENNDASIISYKQFNEKQGDMYPTFSFCFLNNIDIIYNDALMELHLSKKEYNNILRGLVVDSPDKQRMWGRIIAVNPERFITSLQTHIIMADFLTKGANGSLKYRSASDSSDALRKLFYLSLHGPDGICFTRSSYLNIHSNEKRKEDVIKFDFNSLKFIQQSFRQLDYEGKLRIYIHYPHQLIRNLQRPAYEISFQEAFGYGHGVEVSLTVSYVSILKKRHDANVRCNISLIDDDLEFKIRVSEKIGCMPVYWKQMIRHETSLKPCRNHVAYQQIYSVIKNFNTFMSSYDRPCIELMTTINTQETPGKDGLHEGIFRLIIPYATDEFQEIQNVKDLGFETLWSSAGGFIGIFLGYSLLQVPEIFEIDWKKYWKKMKQFSCLTKLLIFLKYFFQGKISKNIYEIKIIVLYL